MTESSTDDNSNSNKNEEAKLNKLEFVENRNYKADESDGDTKMSSTGSEEVTQQRDMKKEANEQSRLNVEENRIPTHDRTNEKRMSDVKIVMPDIGDVSEPLASVQNDASDTCAAEKALKREKKCRFRQKEFKVRPSVLTSLYETKARVIYNMSLAILFLAVSALWLNDYFNKGNIFNHLWIISWNFSQLPSTMCCWTIMFASTIAVPYYGLTIWSSIPSEHVGVGIKVVISTAYLCYIFSLFYYPLKFLLYWQLSSACSFIITVEHTGTSSDWPTLKQFIYYMFCPSLLYRDSYPRAEKRCWRLVLRYGIQCLITIYMMNIAFVLIVHPVFSTMDYKNGVPIGVLIYSTFQSMVPGIICMIAIFYGLLHSWMNMFAEAMRFGDRYFYSNWWNSKNMAEYYRSWNIIVHEWLYVYIYRDFTLVLGDIWGPKVSQVAVFFLSASFHEYWFGVSMRVFYPIIFIMYFIFGGAFFLCAGNMKWPNAGNVIMWFNLIFGPGVFFMAYASEYYARQRCLRTIDNDFVDFIVPRIWSCIKKA